MVVSLSKLSDFYHFEWASTYCVDQEMEFTQKDYELMILIPSFFKVTF